MAKRLSCLIAGHQSAPGGLEWLPSSSKKHFDTHWPGEDDYRPTSFFPNGLVEPKVLVSKECAEGCRMQKGCQRMAKRLCWLIAGHQSAPGVLERWPSSSKSILTRIGLGKMIIHPRPFFQKVWLNQKCWYLKNVQKDVECRMPKDG